MVLPNQSEADPNKPEKEPEEKPGEKKALGNEPEKKEPEKKEPEEKKPEEKPEDDTALGKKKAEGEPEKKAPETYDLKLSDKSLLTEDDLKKVAEEAKKLNLTNEEAQALADGKNQAVQDYVDSGNKVTAGWLDQAKKDSEIGGDNFEQTVLDGNAALERFASPELQDLLYATKFGNHPEVIRAWAKVGKAMRGDKFVVAGGQPPPKVEESERKNRMFPTSVQK